MDTAEFLHLADACLSQVAARLEVLDPEEVDYSIGDGKLTIEFPDGRQFVLNRQSAAFQMWFAAGASAWHYDWDPARQTWVSDKDRHLLYERIAQVVSEKIGHAVQI